MRVLIVGSGGREGAMASKLEQECTLLSVSAHANPSLIGSCDRTGGHYLIADPCDGRTVAQFAKESSCDLAIVSSDNPLEAGVVDHLHAAKIPTVGPTRAGAEIEWNKAFARRLLHDVLPEYTPRFWVLKSPTDARELFSILEAEKLDIVVKPAGLTGGKGVKVMGEHLVDLAAARTYTEQLMGQSSTQPEPVVIEEKLEGVEFTLQALTDGRSVVRVPATYDHPFRYENDTGPGTGGMGSYSNSTELLPFITDRDYEQCIHVVETMVHALGERGRHFNGVLNAGFFKTRSGIKVMEFNARFGDPECINIMAVLDSSALDLFRQIESGTITPSSVSFKRKASVLNYLVSPDYAIRDGKTYNFQVDLESIAQRGANVLFASSTLVDPTTNTYQTVGNSRSVGIVSLGDTIPEAAATVLECCNKFIRGPLEFRQDIGTKEAIDKLVKKVK